VEAERTPGVTTPCARAAAAAAAAAGRQGQAWRNETSTGRLYWDDGAKRRISVAKPGTTGWRDRLWGRNQIFAVHHKDPLPGLGKRERDDSRESFEGRGSDAAIKPVGPSRWEKVPGQPPPLAAVDGANCKQVRTGGRVSNFNLSRAGVPCSGAAASLLNRLDPSNLGATPLVALSRTTPRSIASNRRCVVIPLWQPWLFRRIAKRRAHLHGRSSASGPRCRLGANRTYKIGRIVELFPAADFLLLAAHGTDCFLSFLSLTHILFPGSAARSLRIKRLRYTVHSFFCTLPFRTLIQSLRNETDLHNTHSHQSVRTKWFDFRQSEPPWRVSPTAFTTKLPLLSSN